MRLHNVTFHYSIAARHAASPISFSLDGRRARHCLRGSVRRGQEHDVFSCCCVLRLPIRARVLIDDRRLPGFTGRKTAPRAEFGLVVRRRRCCIGASARENIDYVWAPHGQPTPRSRRRASASAAAEFLREVAGKATHPLPRRARHALSGGRQRQRIAFGAAISMIRRSLLLDEATSSLDANQNGWCRMALESSCRARPHHHHRSSPAPPCSKADRIVVNGPRHKIAVGTATRNCFSGTAPSCMPRLRPANFAAGV